MYRYVPKTYNNRRLLRIILTTITTVALTAIISFLLLFFILERYWDRENGRLDVPWLAVETVQTD